MSGCSLKLRQRLQEARKLFPKDSSEWAARQGGTTHADGKQGSYGQQDRRQDTTTGKEVASPFRLAEGTLRRGPNGSHLDRGNLGGGCKPQALSEIRLGRGGGAPFGPEITREGGSVSNYILVGATDSQLTLTGKDGGYAATSGVRAKGG